MQYGNVEKRVLMKKKIQLVFLYKLTEKNVQPYKKAPKLHEQADRKKAYPRNGSSYYLN